MEAEFVNVFIEKQRDAINDIMARNIMLETRTVLAERSATNAATELKKFSDTEKTIETLRLHNTSMSELIEQQKSEIEAILKFKHHSQVLETKLKLDIDDLEKKLADQDILVQQLQTSINKLTLQKESQRVETERIKKKVREISVE